MWAPLILTLSQMRSSVKWQDGSVELSLAPSPRSQRPGEELFGNFDATVSQKSKTNPVYYS